MVAVSRRSPPLAVFAQQELHVYGRRAGHLRGETSLDDEVLKFFAEDSPIRPSNNLKAMRVSDLLRMSTGQRASRPRTPNRPWTKTFLAHPVPFKPGTHFLYNTSGTYMLSAIVQKATGMTVLDYLRPRLFAPLGIEHPTWETSPQGISAGGFGLSIRTEDIARFGQLYLQKGMWKGKELVPEAWVAAATARQTSNGSNPKSDWDQGYGYQFWRCRHGAYRGDGAFGQYCVVLPDQDAVIAITSGVKDMQAVLNLVWDKLLPAIKSSPQAPDDAAKKQTGADAEELDAVPAERLRLARQRVGQEVRLSGQRPEAGNDHAPERRQRWGVTLVTRFDGVDQRIACGRGTWQEGRVAWARWPGNRRRPAAHGPRTTRSPPNSASTKRPSSSRSACNSPARSCVAVPSPTQVSGRPRNRN